MQSGGEGACEEVAADAERGERGYRADLGWDGAGELVVVEEELSEGYEAA